jgi:hypothetical protein
MTAHASEQDRPDIVKRREALHDDNQPRPTGKAERRSSLQVGGPA